GRAAAHDNLNEVSNEPLAFYASLFSGQLQQQFGFTHREIPEGIEKSDPPDTDSEHEWTPGSTNTGTDRHEWSPTNTGTGGHEWSPSSTNTGTGGHEWSPTNTGTGISSPELKMKGP